MYRFARDEGIDLDELRTRLRKMPDDELLRFGQAAQFLCRDKSARQVFVIQLEEARVEWRRRRAQSDTSHRSIAPVRPASFCGS
jgi:hypothetical protein